VKVAKMAAHAHPEGARGPVPESAAVRDYIRTRRLAGQLGPPPDQITTNDQASETTPRLMSH
jgi:hypothetical protein